MNTADELRRMGIPEALIATAAVNGRLLSEADKSRAEMVTVEARPNGTMRIVVPGPAPGKPRMTQRDKWKKRPCVMRYRDWCDRVREAVGDSLPAEEQVAEVNWTAYFEPPKSWPKKRRVAVMGTIHRSKPDRDNVDKAVLDCLFRRDERIGDGTLRKRWDWVARLEIEILTDT